MTPDSTHTPRRWFRVPTLVSSWAAIALSVTALLGCGSVEAPAASEAEGIQATVETSASTKAKEPETSTEAPLPAQVALFVRWLEAHARATDPEVKDLYFAYYDAAAGEETGEPWFLSPMVSADVLRFYLRLGNLAQATRIGDALLGWQHDGGGKVGGRLVGAFPSEIAKDGQGWAPRYLYDTHDNLVVMEALLDLQEATGQQRYLQAAKRTGDWLRDVMTHGERYGVWQGTLSAPMKGVTDSGDFDNRIAVGRTLLWLPTLHRLAAKTKDQSFAALARDAQALLAKAQTPAGGFYDHYDPGYPAVAYDSSLFRTYGPDGSVVADDSLRAALGLWLLGDDAAAERFSRWISHPNGRVAGYLSISTGEPWFTTGEPVYDDLISTALYRYLADRLGLPDNGEERAYLARTQAKNGGWYWGWSRTLDAPIEKTQATLTGVYALVDLLPQPIETTGAGSA
jgi:hypothetical protein